MLGSPPIRAAIALAVLLLLLVPLRSFTVARGPLKSVAAPTALTKTTAHLEIVSTKWPFTFSVAHLGQVLWQGRSDTASISVEKQLPIPAEGVDLALKISWFESGRAAAKLTLSHDENDPAERTIWGDGHASDVLTFP